MSNDEYQKVGKVLAEGLTGDEIDCVIRVEVRGQERLVIHLNNGGKYVVTPDFDEEDQEKMFAYKYEPAV